MNKLPDLSALDGLSPEERKLALEILNELSQDGKSEILDDLKYSDYEEIPVDVDTFLDDPHYLGQGLWITDEFTGERRCTVFPYWREVLKKIFPDNTTTAVNTVILAGAIGIGKAQPLTAKVLTEHGYKQMGELTLQDRVYGNDGKLHNILGIFPQGKKKICRVSFNDKTNTECCDEHLWTVFNVDYQKWETLETKELYNRGIYRKSKNKMHNYKIPITMPIEFECKELPIDPYVLGVLIGDGCLTHEHVVFASADEELIREVSSRLIENYQVKQLKGKYAYSICKTGVTGAYDPDRKTFIPTPNVYRKHISNLELNVRAEFKHIPQEYLHADVNSRIELLQGLMDTDGSISTDGWMGFSTVSPQLRDDVIFLVQSLGGICKATSKIPSYKNKLGERIYCQRSYTIGIKLPKNIQPFKLTRKLERISEKTWDPARFITNIEYVGEDECQCIYIDSKEHLYLTNDFIVTHNTFAGVLIQLYLLYRMLCLKDPYSAWGMQPIDKITFSMMNITIEAAEGVGWSKLQELIQSSPWFMEHGNMNASRTNPTWQPPKGVELVFGSSNRTVVGRALFCLDGDTIIATSKGDKKLIELVDQNIEVISVDNQGNKVISNTCTVKPTIKTDQEYQIELEDGTLIKCTPNHRFMLENGIYKEAQYLYIGTKLSAFIDTADQVVITNITAIANKSTKQYYDVIEAAPHNNFLVKTSSGYIISHNCNLTDEVNFSIGSNVEKQKAKQRKLIAQIDARMRSRFLRGTYLPTVNIIISSADTEQAFLQSYIEQKRQNESKSTLIVEEPQWVVDPRKGTPNDKGAFYVAVGNKFLAHELLPVDASEEMVSAYREKGYQMIKIPPGYHEVFLDNLDQALMDIIGLASSSSTKYISGIRLNQIKTDEYRNPFTKDVIEVGNSPDDYNQYSNFFDLSRVDPRDITRPLFIHLDMSLSGDKTGIAGTWITGKRPGVAGEESTGRELEFKAAFSVSIKAPKGYQVSFEKTRNFIRWLRDRGFSIKAISMDTFQSANMAQSLTSDGFKTQVLSVDRVDNAGLENGRPVRICKPYAFFKSAIYEHHLKLYHKCDLLTEEITNLERLSDGHIDHPANGGSKDQADAIVGSLYTASQFAEEYSYDYGENLDAALDVNISSSDELKKQQMITEFQEELIKIYADMALATETLEYQKKQEYETYMDISQGIIIL